jgi:hypothetical protein
MSTKKTLNDFNLNNIEIIISQNSSTTENFAAEELQKYIHNATRQKLPIRSSATPDNQHIYIGDSGLHKDMSPVVDNNPEVEMFLPALLGI